MNFVFFLSCLAEGNKSIHLEIKELARRLQTEIKQDAIRMHLDCK
jgi:hypothetical protein